LERESQCQSVHRIISVFITVGVEMLIFGRIVAALLGLVMLVNASFMLVSPRAWFNLPSWLRASGALTKEKYSTGFRAVQVRVTGALMIGIVCWVIYDMFLSR
jgi:hypothetical protein